MTRGLLRVVTYHRIASPDATFRGAPSLVSATPAAFERQVRCLASRYQVLGAEEVIDARRRGRPLPARAVLITFDDAYRDFGENAWPILRRHRLPAALFVPTAYPGNPAIAFWWDRLHCAIASTRLRSASVPPLGTLPLHTPAARRASLRRLQSWLKTMPHAEAMRLIDRACAELDGERRAAADVLTWNELRELARDGVAICPHTRTHPALTRMPLDEARAEIRGSREDLVREVGTALPVFAYPFGDHDADVAAIVREEGFDLAVTSRYGHNSWPPDDPLRLHRTNVSMRVTPLALRARLTVCGAAIDRWRDRRRAPVRAPSRDAVSTSPSPGGGSGLKVAYIMSRFPKLSETFVLNEMRAAASFGVPIEVYPLLRARQRTTHPEVEEWVRRAHFHPFVSPRIVHANVRLLFERPSTYLRVWREVLRGTWGSANFFIGAIGIFPKAVRFAQEMRAEGITHVHAHFATHPAVAALIVHRLTGIPFSFTAHGSDLHVDRRMLPAKVDAAAFVVAVSRFNREIVVRDCGERTRDKVHVIHCGVDAAFFAPAGACASGGTFQVICVASFEQVKGHFYLVEACRLLEERRVDFRCHLVGDGPRRREIERQIAALRLADRVVLHGAQPRAAVARLLATANAAVLASHPTKEGKREGIPVSLMEAMASGLPVVATAISGIPELVDDEVTGLLVPSGDPGALANALARLAGDAALRGRMGAAGRDKVIREFDLRTNTLKLLARFGSGGPGRAAAAGTTVHRRDQPAVGGIRDVERRHGDGAPAVVP